ncbi:MAG: DUF481 domain-containing protein [Planctomycetota bacterium]
MRFFRDDVAANIPPMNKVLSSFVAAALGVSVCAQDKVTLTNGDVLTGEIVSMADGKITIQSPVLDEVVVAVADVTDLVTAAPVVLQTQDGERMERRILGIENDSFRLSGGGADELPVMSLGMINPPEKTAPKWTGSLKLTALYTSGNTRRESGGLLFDASRTTDWDRITLDGIWNYGTDEDAAGVKTLTQRRAGGGAKYDYFLNKRWYALGTARALGDTLADLDLRLTIGAGAGYTIIDDGTTLLLSEAGFSYYSEDYRQPGLATEETVTLRLAYRLEHQLSEQTKIVHRVEAFPSIEDGSDFYLQAVTELSTSLTDSMVASLAHTLDYDNTPAAGRKSADNRVFLTVGWSF